MWRDYLLTLAGQGDQEIGILHKIALFFADTRDNHICISLLEVTIPALPFAGLLQFNIPKGGQANMYSYDNNGTTHYIFNVTNKTNLTLNNKQQQTKRTK